MDLIESMVSPIQPMFSFLTLSFPLGFLGGQTQNWVHRRDYRQGELPKPVHFSILSFFIKGRKYNKNILKK